MLLLYPGSRVPLTHSAIYHLPVPNPTSRPPQGRIYYCYPCCILWQRKRDKCFIFCKRFHIQVICTFHYLRPIKTKFKFRFVVMKLSVLCGSQLRCHIFESRQLDPIVNRIETFTLYFYKIYIVTCRGVRASKITSSSSADWIHWHFCYKLS
jgi:hypothetical protein